jgi:bifunctional non-homologous end joining protein LigD
MSDPTGQPADLPALIPPMLATLGAMPTGQGWGFELKWDGVRAVTYIQRGAVRVVSRNDLDVTKTYPELATLGGLLHGRNAIVDGEIIALDPAGHPSFARLQERMHVRAPGPALLAAVPVLYHVFDVLHLDGESTLRLPYVHRRELLTDLDMIDDTVRVPPHFVDVDGRHVLTAAEAGGLEGVIAKRLTSTYQPGRRSPDWIKVPLNRTQEVIIIGYKAGGGRRTGTLGSLVLAVPDPTGDLVYAGGVGTGFTVTMLGDLHRRLAPLQRPTPAAPVPREHTRGVHWVDPVLVGEVAYRTWTPDGRMRHPSWRGLRPDRTPDDIHRTAPAPATRPTPETASPQIDGAMQTPDGSWRVEALHSGTTHWYRIIHADNTIDWLTITDVEHLLHKAGIDISQLHNADPAA